MNREEKIRCDKNWKLCQDYWNKKSKELKIEGWSFEMNNTKTRLAQCNYTKKKVCVSSYFLRGVSCNQKKIRNTILHEIAHILAGYGSGHNHEWKAIIVALGGSPERCGTMDKVPGSYLLYCPNKCFEKKYHRKPKVEGKLCKRCNSSPKIKNL